MISQQLGYQLVYKADITALVLPLDTTSSLELLMYNGIFLKTLKLLIPCYNQKVITSIGLNLANDVPQQWEGFCAREMSTSVFVHFSQVYLSLPSTQSLTEGHCLVAPLQHHTAATVLDEDIWEEIQVSSETVSCSNSFVK